MTPGRAAERQAAFAAAADQIAYLRAHSGLPGPRGNLELLQAAVDLGDEAAFRAWIAVASALGGATESDSAGGATESDSAAAPVAAHPTDEYLVACGVVGLGRLAAEGRTDVVEELRTHASDGRWRVREAVAMALQRIGDANVNAMLNITGDWAGDRPYVQRAAIAGASEPRLLRDPSAARRAVELVDRVTVAFAAAVDRRSDEARTLRQALGYCWSVVVAADPEHGRPTFERWVSSDDADIAWIVRENLGKKRLQAAGPAWARELASRIEARQATGRRRTLGQP